MTNLTNFAQAGLFHAILSQAYKLRRSGWEIDLLVVRFRDLGAQSDSTAAKMTAAVGELFELQRQNKAHSPTLRANGIEGMPCPIWVVAPGIGYERGEWHLGGVEANGGVHRRVLVLTPPPFSSDALNEFIPQLNESGALDREGLIEHCSFERVQRSIVGAVRFALQALEGAHAKSTEVVIFDRVPMICRFGVESAQA